MTKPRELAHQSNPEYLSSQERLSFWLNTAVKLFQYCQENEIPILFRGSLHAYALSGKLITDGYKEEKKQWRDIDVYIHSEKFDETLVAKLSRVAEPIPLGFGGNSVIKVKEESVFLTYKEVAVPAPSSVLEPQMLSVKGQELPFFQPFVHYHLFGTVGFAYRLRDRAKRSLYAQYARESSVLSQEEKDKITQAFRKYKKLRKQKYPLESLLHTIRGHIPAPKSKRIRTVSKKIFSILDKL